MCTCFARSHTSTDRGILFHQCFVPLIKGLNPELYLTLSPYGCEEHRDGIKRAGLYLPEQMQDRGRNQGKVKIRGKYKATREHIASLCIVEFHQVIIRTPHYQIFLNVPFYSSVLSLQWSLPSFILPIPIHCVYVSALMYVRLHSSRSGGCNPQVRQDGISADSVDPDT